MQETAYHKRIIEYYRETENAYKDSWDLDNSLAIHYGFRDEKAGTFRASLKRMNEVMVETAGITAKDHVLDAGCGVGGSSIYLAAQIGCKVTGITLSKRQEEQAAIHATKQEVQGKVTFCVMDYCATSFPDESFDVVWGCESICYAESKEKFIREAFRVLKPGGRLVVADGFVTAMENNNHQVIRKWLDGWQVNFLETPGRFNSMMAAAGFRDVTFRNISKEVIHSSRRLYRFYFLASLYLFWKKISFAKPATVLQKKNILACKYQYHGLRKGLWQYGIISAFKP